MVAKVDAVVEGHEEGVGIPTTRVSNNLSRIEAANYTFPITAVLSSSSV